MKSKPLKYDQQALKEGIDWSVTISETGNVRVI